MFDLYGVTEKYTELRTRIRPDPKLFGSIRMSRGMDSDPDLRNDPISTF
jgi:hypothetical protein